MKVAVMADDRDSLDHGLRDDHPIEGIAVMEIESRQKEGVSGLDGKKPDSVAQNPSGEKVWKRCFELKPTKTHFNRDFPQTGGADQNLVLAVRDRFPRT